MAVRQAAILASYHHFIMNRPTGWSLKAILLGWATDAFGSQIGTSLVAVPMALQMTQSGLSPQQIEARLLNEPIALILFLIVGLIFTVTGGFVAAHSAGHNEVRHAAASGALTLAFHLALISFTPRLPNWYLALGLLLVVPCSMLGGYIRSKQPTLENPDADNPPIPEP
ncbi:MAG: hypothetical protein JWN98_1243 [Abditibacteriota bacterium]|nr:hypothetical protein [Abditibacteriota bacterium]